MQKDGDDLRKLHSKLPLLIRLISLFLGASLMNAVHVNFLKIYLIKGWDFTYENCVLQRTMKDITLCPLLCLFFVLYIGSHH